MPERIVSLLPSATETLFALGLGNRVVAVSHECDYPPEVADLPRAQGVHVDGEQTPAMIDMEVRGRRMEQLPIFEVKPEVLREVDADVVVTQDTCEVCAAGPGDVDRVLSDWAKGDRPRIVTVHAHDLEGVFADILRLGRELGAGKPAKKLVRGLRDRLDDVTGKVDGLDRLRVVVLDWLDPLMAAGHWAPEMVRAAGGEPVLVKPGEPSRYIDRAELTEAAPDVLVLAPCGYDLQRVEREAPVVARGPGWDGLPAVLEDRVYGVDAGSVVSRPGPRLVDGVEMLAAVLHPEKVEARPDQETMLVRLHP